MKEKLILSLTKKQLRESLKKLAPDVVTEKKPLEFLRPIILNFTYNQIINSIPKKP